MPLSVAKDNEMLAADGRPVGHTTEHPPPSYTEGGNGPSGSKRYNAPFLFPLYFAPLGRGWLRDECRHLARAEGETLPL